MKTLAMALISFGFLTSLAQAALPSEITNLIDRPGILTVIENGKNVGHLSGSNCSIGVNQWNEQSVVIDSVGQYDISADLSDAVKSVKNGVTTYVTTDTGKRAGGSVCGDYSKLTSYTKSVIVNGDSLTIRQKYSCFYIERFDVFDTCKLR